MSDDAVAPVIAVMLILAAVATLFVIFNGAYVPSLKEAAEIEHIRNVESSFRHFSSDIGQAITVRKDGQELSEPVPLGGGDIFLNTLKSGGSLAVTQEPAPVYNISLYDGTGSVMATTNGTLVTITFTSVGNFWQDQGYRWQEGYLNVTKYGLRQAPLDYSTMTEVTNGFEPNGTLATFAGSFGSAEYSLNETLFQNETPTLDKQYIFSPRSGTCSRILLRAVNLTTSQEHSFVSGNGFGNLELVSSTKAVPMAGVSFITVASDGTLFGNATFREWNESISEVAGACGNSLRYTPVAGYTGDGLGLYTVDQSRNPVEVTLETGIVEIGVR